jgi:hypothetical protein
MYDLIAIVSGTRETNTPRLEEAIYYHIGCLCRPRMLVVHGACGWRLGGPENESLLTGADRFASECARAYDLPVKTFAADWDGEGRAAGPRRSFRMIDWAIENSLERVLLAFPVPSGKGTQRAIDYATRKGVLVREWFE